MKAHNKLSIYEINDKKPNNSRLTALSFAEPKVSISGNKRTRINCYCSCGEFVIVDLTKIINGHTKSCGCALKGCQKGKGVKYAVVNYHIRGSYQGMIKRCYDPNNKSYPLYGGRGVIVCDEWKNNYQNFLDWSLANGWQKGLEIDKDIKGNGVLYSPNTCCWVTKIENCNNRRTNVKYLFEGKMLTAPEICRLKGINYQLIRGRISRGMPLDQAISKPRMKNQFIEA